MQIILHRIIETPVPKKTSELLELEENLFHDWFSYCREIYISHNQRDWAEVKLGDGQGGLIPNNLIQENHLN